MRSDFHGTSPLVTGPMVLGLALLSGTFSPARADEPTNGQWVEIIGRVTDPGGQPLTGVTVELTAYRRYFSLKGFERREKDFRRVSAQTDEQGEFDMRWLWDDYFNRFELKAGVPAPGPEGEKLHVLETQVLDLERRAAVGLPVVAPLVVDDPSFFLRLRAFEAALSSDEERRVFQQAGLPDEVRKVEYPNRSEISWWYFGRGKVYRFVDGELAEEAAFDPVVRFQPDNGEPEP